MQRPGHDQPDIAVNAAAENVFARARGEFRIPPVVEPHGHDVVAGFHRIGDVQGKSRVTALVFADAPAVHKNFRILKRAVEFEEQPLAGPFGRNLERFPITAVTHVKFVGEEIGKAERMGQSNVIPLRIIVAGHLRSGRVAQLEFPFAVEVELLARRFGGQQQGRKQESGQK